MQQTPPGRAGPARETQNRQKHYQPSHRKRSQSSSSAGACRWPAGKKSVACVHVNMELHQSYGISSATPRVFCGVRVGCRDWHLAGPPALPPSRHRTLLPNCLHPKEMQAARQSASIESK